MSNTPRILANKLIHINDLTKFIVQLCFNEGFLMRAQGPTSKQFQVLFEAAPNGVLVVDSAGAVVACNARLATMFGYRQDELIGLSCDVLVPKQWRRRHAQLCKKFSIGEPPRARLMGMGRDFFGARKNGSKFPVEVGLSGITAREGGLVVATVVDISERKRVEKEGGVFARAQATMQAFEQLGVPAAVIQYDRRVLMQNPLFAQIGSQFLVTADKMEFSNKTADRCLMANLNGNIDQNIRSVFSIPASNGRAPAIVRLLPIFDASNGALRARLFIVILKPFGVTELRSVDLLREVFGLTPAEARVAACCGAGLRVRQVAERLGRSNQTIRNQLKCVFAKIGVSSQSQLAALITTLSI